jgi:hypothetical protein
MSEPITYPAVDDGLLTPFRVLRLLFRANPDLFERSQCPYPEDTKAFLKGMIEGTGGVDPERKSFLDGAEDVYAALEEQIALTLEDIRILEGNQSRLDQRDKVQFLKAKPALLEKLIELRERVNNMKTLSTYMKKVYAFIDKQLTPDQRTQLMADVGEVTL